MILTFIMSPLGRKIGLGVLLALALFIFVKVHDSRVYNQGKAEGVRVTVISTDAQLKVTWAAAEASSAAKQKDLETAASDLQKTQDALKVQNEQLQNTIKEDRVNFRKKIDVTIPTVVSQMTTPQVEAALDVLAPTPQDVLIALQQNVELRNEINVLDGRVAAITAAAAREADAYDKQITNVTNQRDLALMNLTLMTGERDHFEDEVHQLTKKKCGIFHKIFTLGLGSCK